MERETLDPASALRYVVPILRARKIGFPSPPWLEGRAPSQSAMYSIMDIGRPATTCGSCQFDGSGSGKMVDATPVVERARSRRAMRVEVNHDG